MNWEPSERFAEWPGCRACAHYAGGRCIAFPDHIPFDIVCGAVDHLVPRPGQVGDIVFEPLDPDVLRRTGKRVPLRATAEQPA
jgi:hypothetical protein